MSRSTYDYRYARENLFSRWCNPTPGPPRLPDNANGTARAPEATCANQDGPRSASKAQFIIIITNTYNSCICDYIYHHLVRSFHCA